MSLILSGTNGLSDVDGTAATPAIRGTDANTGIFFGVDTIGISTNGTTAVTVSSAQVVTLANALPVASGGTNATSASAARTSLGLVIGTDVLAPTGSAASLTSFPTLNQNTSGTAAGLSATLAVTSGGTGQTSYTNGQLLIGNTTGNTLTKATLSARTGISIHNGAGSISIAATGGGTVTSVSGTGTASGLTLSGTVTTSGSLTLSGTATVASLTTASGSAPSYSARAWVNFNGTGTVAIRASGNVSSITDNGTGDYTINFSTAMSDANYSAVHSIGSNEVGLNAVIEQSTEYYPSRVASSMRIYTGFTYSGGYAVQDEPAINVSIFR
jgi:hypothetical protein